MFVYFIVLNFIVQNFIYLLYLYFFYVLYCHSTLLKAFSHSILINKDLALGNIALISSFTFKVPIHIHSNFLKFLFYIAFSCNSSSVGLLLLGIIFIYFQYIYIYKSFFNIIIYCIYPIEKLRLLFTISTYFS